MTNETSPRPWKIVGTYRDIIVGADGVKVCELYGGLQTQQENAALIVDAVNERDRLRDIVRRLYQMCCEDWVHTNAEGRALLREARAAIGEEEK